MRVQLPLLLTSADYQHASSTVMALPLPIDPDFRKMCVEFWLDDIDDRLEMNRLNDAELSWKEANTIYLSLPAGFGNMVLEDRIYEQRVKLDKRINATNENNF
jgi:hypothetical protein